ncbi:MAG TPA: hypothetical protein VKQ72_20685, partial [Aggregatilineales bacterium]|nr:hypothetical protein [Aggregatilineales bacterium]
MLLPVLAPTLTFLQLQITNSTSPTGVSVTNGWAYDYRWLFQNVRVVGIWGLSFYQSYGGTIVSAGVTIVGTLLTGILMTGVALIIGRRRESLNTLIPAVAISVFWGIAIATYALNMLWISGKAFAMGYPFAVLTLTLCVVRFAHWTQRTKRWRTLNRALSMLYIIWIVSQCG